MSEREILHIEVGSATWTPSPEELQAIAETFQAAGKDPLGSIVATRSGVKVTTHVVNEDTTLVVNGRNIGPFGPAHSLVSK